MKIISIIGSPNGMRGNTGALLEIVLEGARNQGAETRTVAVKAGEVKPCLGCDTCHKKGVCPQKDEFNEIKERVMEADGVILASPNYIFHVSAQLKAFIDRCCGVVHCLGFEGKYGASVVSSGGGEERPIAEYMNYFLAVTGVMPVGAVWATMSQIEGRNFPEDVREKAFALGKRLVTAWSARERTAEYADVTSRFRERMRSLVLWRKEEWPHEYGYWRDRDLKGGMNP